MAIRKFWGFSPGQYTKIAVKVRKVNTLEVFTQTQSTSSGDA